MIHFAGWKAVGESGSKPLEYYTNNLGGSTLSILSAMKKYRVKIIVFSSSATVYGTLKIVPISKAFEIGNTTNPNGTTKLFVEQVLNYAHRIQRSTSLFCDILIQLELMKAD